MTAETDRPLPFDIIAFVGALFLAPIMVTLMTCWLAIPVMALILGGPVYLVVGIPVLLWMVGRYPPEVWRFALAGFAANVVLCLLAVAMEKIPLAIQAGYDELFGFAVCGLLFGPVWAGTFAPLYRRFNRKARLVPQS